MKYLVLLLLLLSPSIALAAPLACNDLDGQPLNSAEPPLNFYFDPPNYTPTTSATKYEDLGGGDYYAHYFIPSGTNERAPFTIEWGSEDFTTYYGTAYGNEIYVEWTDRFDASYPWPTSGQKIFRAGFQNATYPEEKKEIGFGVKGGNGYMSLDYFCGFWGNTTNCDGLEGVENGSAYTTDGLDHTYGVWIKYNTPGVADGFVRLYIDGVLEMSIESANMQGNNTRGMDYFWIGGNYSMLSGGTAASDGERWVDDICVYATKPTEGGGGGATPIISSVSATSATYANTDTVTVNVTFSETVTVVTTGGTPTLDLALDAGGPEVATYTGGTGTAVLTFDYVVDSNDEAADLDYDATDAFNLNSATVRDADTNDADVTLDPPGGPNALAGTSAVVIDGVAPTVSTISATTASYYDGATVAINVTFDETVNVDTTGGVPTLDLALTSGGPEVGTYVSGTGSSVLIFNFIVDANDFTKKLDYDATDAFNLNSGVITDVAGNSSGTITLAAPGGAGSLSQSNVMINPVNPTVDAVIKKKKKTE